MERGPDDDVIVEDGNIYICPNSPEFNPVLVNYWRCDSPAKEVFDFISYCHEHCIQLHELIDELLECGYIEYSEEGVLVPTTKGIVEGIIVGIYRGVILLGSPAWSLRF